MARKTTKRPAAAARRIEFQPHDLLLAGIGAVSLGRKQVAHFYANGFDGVVVGVADGVAELRSRAEDAVQRAEEAVQSAAKSVSGKVVSLRKQAEAKAKPVQKKVIALANEAKAQAQSRLAPVLAKLGVKKAPAKRAPARKKSAAKRTRRAA